jgi:hypothetical protein
LVNISETFRFENWSRGALLAVLLVALWMRVDRLAEVPEGVDYDEAGNFVLAQEIAAGETHPVFVRAYAGREAIFYWLAAGSMALLGQRLFAFRLAAALCGVGTVLFGYLLAREMFHAEPEPERQGVPLLTAALLAVSYWPVHISRYGVRANAMTLFLSATMALLWRGLRRERWIELAAAGVLCGLAANTYLAVRALPLLLLLFALWVIATWPSARRAPRAGARWRRGARYIRRAGQFALFGLAALVALAPLALFFVRNPEYLYTRMSQVSIFDPAIHGGDPWGTLGRVTLQMLGDFTVRGDESPLYNLPGKPIFGPLLGAAFYGGLLLCAWRAWRRTDYCARTNNQARTPYLLILAWLPVMMLPNILGARGVPHHLRGAGMLPAVYIVPALGLAAALRWALARLVRPERQLAWGRRATALLAALLLVSGALQTRHLYFEVWTRQPGTYYTGSVGLRHAAEYLDRWDPDEVDLWVSNSTYRHSSYAVTCRNYRHLRWFSGDTLILPPPDGRPALYVFDDTNRLDPLLAHYLPADTLQERELGPDGRVGFEAYLVPPERVPHPQPQFSRPANLGNTIALLGYDLNLDASGCGPLSGGMLDVTLYGRVLAAVDRDDYAFFVHLVDDLGFRWGGDTFFHYPSLQWRPGEVLIFRQRIPIAPGAPPDAYTLDVGVFSASLDARLPLLNEAGQMAGTVAHLGPIAIGRAPAPPDDLAGVLAAVQQPLDREFGDRLTLLGCDRDRGDLRPGETLALSLYWQAAAPVEPGLQVALWLEGEGGEVPLWEGDPVHGRYPFHQWTAGEFVRDRYALRLPLDAPAGDYGLRLALRRAGGDTLGEVTALGTIHVRASDRLWAPPPGLDLQPVEARLGEQVELLGYALDRQEARPGEGVHLTLAWRCLREMDAAYTVFTHLLDEGGQVRGQKDNPPQGGRYPTTLWAAGEVVVDEYDLPVPPDAPPGRYQIEVGMYDPADMRRLPTAAGDRVLLGEVRVTP